MSLGLGLGNGFNDAKLTKADSELVFAQLRQTQLRTPNTEAAMLHSAYLLVLEHARSLDTHGKLNLK